MGTLNFEKPPFLSSKVAPEKLSGLFGGLWGFLNIRSTFLGLYWGHIGIMDKKMGATI